MLTSLGVSGSSSGSGVVVLDSDDEDNGGHSVTIGGVASSSMDGEQCGSDPDKDTNTSAIDNNDALAQDNSDSVNDNESSALPGDDS